MHESPIPTRVQTNQFMCESWRKTPYAGLRYFVYVQICLWSINHGHTIRYVTTMIINLYIRCLFIHYWWMLNIFWVHGQRFISSLGWTSLLKPCRSEQQANSIFESGKQFLQTYRSLAIMSVRSLGCIDPLIKIDDVPLNMVRHNRHLECVGASPIIEEPLVGFEMLLNWNDSGHVVVHNCVQGPASSNGVCVPRCMCLGKSAIHNIHMYMCVFFMMVIIKNYSSIYVSKVSSQPRPYGTCCGWSKNAVSWLQLLLCACVEVHVYYI